MREQEKIIYEEFALALGKRPSDMAEYIEKELAVK